MSHSNLSPRHKRPAHRQPLLHSKFKPQPKLLRQARHRRSKARHPRRGIGAARRGTRGTSAPPTGSPCCTAARRGTRGAPYCNPGCSGRRGIGAARRGTRGCSSRRGIGAARRGTRGCSGRRGIGAARRGTRDAFISQEEELSRTETGV
ncbi:hypothetical protein CYMTET_38729 [Cymbomonas tetramitiformis]|uniref:Uncharacterized protein n=1 Tax=Cymbomonas tetramitiformis TaxID=36881 RepID=A0AAE0CCZ1_9CHLO|nr:hypothetical protein CYMTET_38729 [Cymbomonas tetramitiformis]